MSMLSRIVLGSLVTSYAIYDIFTINNLQCYQSGKLTTKKILTILKLPIYPPKEGDLVLTAQKQNGQLNYNFKYVYVAENRYSPFERMGTSLYVPSGFVMFKDPATGQTSMQCLGSIIGQYNFDITRLLTWSN